METDGGGRKNLRLQHRESEVSTLQFNVIIDLVALLIICSVWLAGMRKNRLQREDRELFNALLFTITLIFLMDIPAWLLDGRLFAGVRTLLQLTNTAYYALQILYCYFWILFTDSWSFRSMVRLRRRAVWYAVPMIAELALILLNLKTGWIFTLDAVNVYQRGAYYLANLIPYYLYILGAIIVTLHGILTADPIRRRQNSSLLIFMFLPICGTLLETFTYGVSWLWPFVALSLLMVYLEIQQQALAEERVSSARRDQDARVAIMLSQIQPHFLYNSLACISQLCEKDPKRAKKATLDFSEYLRANLKSLDQREPIPFETELQHLKTYLNLEKMGFGEELTVIYDLQVTEFHVPSLTVQPLMENAVKYGVGAKEEGGIVTLSAKETDDSYLVIVSDDGVGFDPDVPKSDGRMHIGIDNVRARLAAQCGGTLDIISQKGVGTIATIRIPKQDVNGRLRRSPL